MRDLGFPEVDNGQTRRISGLAAGFGRCTGEMLNTAQRNLRHRFSAVGVQERFDESLLTMKRSLGWPQIQYIPALVNRERDAAPPLAPATRALIVEHNELDLRLHAFAAELLDDAIGREGETFALELERFCLANEQYVERWNETAAD